VSAELVSDAAPNRSLSPRTTQFVTFGGAFLCFASFLRFGFDGRALVGAIFAATLLVVAAFDLEHRMVPNRIVLPATAVVFALQLAFFPGHALEWTLAAFGSALFFLLAFLTYRGGLGMGDVKLALLLGAALGESVIAALIIGTFAAAAFAVFLLVREGADARKKAIPLAPFLAFGGLVTLFF
jgi:leader peptidase (prepilin peptidase)/N-methyltransferase